MRTKIGILLMIVGVFLMAASLGLYLHNDREQRDAGTASHELMTQLVEVIQEHQASEREPADTPTAETLAESFGAVVKLPQQRQMTVEEINGYPYIGFVGIPALEKELPVMAEWSYSRLQIAPCRFTGNLYEDNLVIMAHNYDSHFGALQDLRIGDIVTFTVIEGETTEYEVVALDVLEATDVDEMIEGFYDLTLFTCTYGGKSRVTVRCNRT